MSDPVRNTSGPRQGTERKGTVEYVFTLPEGEPGSANVSHSPQGFTATFSLPKGGTIQFGAQVTGEPGDQAPAA
ncbi:MULTISPECIES: hypothetical protein [unclassified Streptomyces]|uniref:hypothetical protein n=1 Tax=unclassified Streptomyces TaxID=2593676 RepID=UPI001012B3F7|nr:hypothetical protein [Streptomyces sp. GZWMJZ-114]